MKKQMGSVLLVAGTCIGAGMIALPMMLAQLGLIPSIILMLLMWGFSYYTALIGLELNLRAGKGLTLGQLGRHFSGPIAESVGVLSIKLLSYALLAVYIYGSASILQKLLVTSTSSVSIATWYAAGAILLLLLPIKLLDYVNRFLFIGLLIIVAILVVGLVSTMTFGELPLIAENYNHISVWKTIIPAIFTSFGFQIIFHTLTNYCHKDVKVLKKAFLWGSLIPAIVYIVWTSSILSVVHHKNPDFYQQMLLGKADVGDLIRELSNIAKWQSVQLLVWWISLLAIVTSVLGVGVGLCDSVKSMLSNSISNTFIRNVISSVVTILPAYIVAVLVPNAFIAVLGFAGMILVVIAILQPIYLLCKSNNSKRFYYSELKNKYVISLLFLIGLGIIICEIFNMI